MDATLNYIFLPPIHWFCYSSLPAPFKVHILWCIPRRGLFSLSPPTHQHSAYFLLPVICSAPDLWAMEWCAGMGPRGGLGETQSWTGRYHSKWHLKKIYFLLPYIFRFSYPLLFEINQFDPLNITLSNFFSERVINKMGVIRLERVTPTNLTVLRDINLSIFPILTMDRWC